ncbi:MAG: hypothetical protein PHS27_02415 [Candidatus Pacebacteria bacterium]|nr:hypothetical protein [Candidatus Paceibacterota bacterium]
MNKIPTYLYDPDLIANVLKIFGLGAISFIAGIFAAPALTNFLYRHKLWKKTARNTSIDGKTLEVFTKFHKEKETSVPRFGGLLVWAIPLGIAAIFVILSRTQWPVFEKLDFFSRSQTWLPFFALIMGALIGLLDDFLQTKGKGKYIGGGLSLKTRLLVMTTIGLIAGIWFYFKLDWRTLHIPGYGDIFIGLWYIPLFVITMLATYSGGVIDGLDGLAGGSFATIFAALGAITFFKGQVDLAGFCTVVVGAILAFLWFNIPPARFYMGETGVMGLCAALTVVIFLSDSVLLLPIIGILLVLEAASVIIQLLSKKFLKKKIFLASPLHHHFEAKGWPHYKITMRFWVIGIIAAIIGIAISLFG